MRLGIIDFDTSHVGAFVRRVNKVGIEKEQWVDGAKFVVGCPGKSVIFPERIAEETASVAKLGLPLVSTAEDMLQHELDAVFVESNCGAQHLERAKFFLDHKIPLFIDKPFTCSSAEAQEIFKLADKAGVPVMSSSALRYAPEIVQAAKEQQDKAKVVSCVAYGPGPQHPKNPGLFHYGIHAVEMLFTILGPGCEWLTAVSNKTADLITGHWKDGRIGTVCTTRPTSDYGLTVNISGKIVHHKVSTAIIYRELLSAILEMLKRKQSSIRQEETKQIVRFIELATVSAANHGIPQYF